MEDKKTIGVLFVCLGNICRSPMAEAVFRQLVVRENLGSRFHIDSAGIGNWHTGNPPHHGTRDILDRYGISYEGMRARQVAREDFSQFDYIVAMDRQNEQDLKSLAQQTEAGKIIKLLDLVPELAGKEVPDPYYTGNFDEVYELVEKGCQALLKTIRQREAFRAAKVGEMRDMDISKLNRSANNLDQMKFIQTSTSTKPRSEPEIILLMRSTRNRFLKSLDEGKIQIKSEREWILR